jgi:hypothetical protein
MLLEATARIGHGAAPALVGVCQGRADPLEALHIASIARLELTHHPLPIFEQKVNNRGPKVKANRLASVKLLRLAQLTRQTGRRCPLDPACQSGPLLPNAMLRCTIKLSRKD